MVAITIEKYSSDRENEVSELAVKPEQQIFTVGNIKQVIESLNQDEHPHLIIADDKTVGFFLLDCSYSDTYKFNANKALGVRALLVDQRYQGQGFATKALKQLPGYVQQHYPQFEALQLTVNCRNKPAYKCYVQCGFNDSGELYLGGPAGPQHILQQKIA